MKLAEAKSEFIQSWGKLGTSWGINKAMAQIHALLLVSPEGLCTEDLMNELQISRGNANMNIRALLDWGIVHKELRIGERKEFFTAEKDIMELARVVTKERRRREIEPMLKVLNKIQEVENDKSDEVIQFKKTTTGILDLANKVDGLLDKFSRNDKNWFYKLILKL
jgi:DNA-binding transcriptional regulator GbsR (MarR family)